MNILDFQLMKQRHEKISIVTCYDYTSAKIVAQSHIDCILIGDSLAMTMHGHATTIPATIDLMALHVQAVARGAPHTFKIADMPFLAHRKGLTETLNAVEQLIRAGAEAIKIEGADGNEELIHHLVESGIPVMGHLGMTPQSVLQLGGFRVQGKQQDLAEKIFTQAKTLEKAGCFSMVLECIPNILAKKITDALSIPTIGIGAGADTDGQVLVFQDLLGLNLDFKPKLAKTYLNAGELIKTALNHYHQEVKAVNFPAEEHCY